MNEKLEELGLATIGLGVTIKDKAKKLGRKLIQKGEANKKRVLAEPKKKFSAGMHMAGKEALVISRKSLQMLERELKKLEGEAKKVEKFAKKAVKKRIAKVKTKKKKR